MIDHKTVPLFDPFSQSSVDIDENIAPLIQALWDAGIETVNSCENNVPENWIWIDFYRAKDAEHFLNLVAEYDVSADPNDEDNLSFYERIYGEWGGEHAWMYKTFPHDRNMGWIINEDENSADTFCVKTPEDTDTFFSISIRFHKSDYKEVLKRVLEKHPKPMPLP